MPVFNTVQRGHMALAGMCSTTHHRIHETYNEERKLNIGDNLDSLGNRSGHNRCRRRWKFRAGIEREMV